MNINSSGARSANRQGGYTFVEILIVFGILIALGIAALFFFTQQGRATEYRQVGENIARVINTERSIRTAAITPAAAANAIAQALRESPVVQGTVTVTGSVATGTATAGNQACPGGDLTDVGIRIAVAAGTGTPATGGIGDRVPDAAAAGLLQESINGALQNMFARRDPNELIDGAPATAAAAATALNAAVAATGGGQAATLINICLSN